MITKGYLVDVVEKHFWEDDFFLIDVDYVPGKRISIYVDREQGITIDECAGLSRSIYHTLEDKLQGEELRVSSPGLDMPLKVVRQYQKNISREIEVTTSEGKKNRGRLESAGDAEFVIEMQMQVKPEGRKKKEWQIIKQKFRYDEIKSARVVVAFK